MVCMFSTCKYKTVPIKQNNGVLLKGGNYALPQFVHVPGIPEMFLQHVHKHGIYSASLLACTSEIPQFRHAVRNFLLDQISNTPTAHYTTAPSI